METGGRKERILIDHRSKRREGLNADGQPFIYLGGFCYLVDAEQKLKEEEMEYQKLIKSMLESNDPVLMNYAKTLTWRDNR